MINPPSPDHPGTTLTAVLAMGRSLRLYGRLIQDLAPAGDLGLPLDPDGPIALAYIRLYTVGHQPSMPRLPLLVSVYGPGQAPAEGDDLAEPGERCWTPDLDDRLVHIQVEGSTWRLLLQTSAGPLTPPRAPPRPNTAP